VPDAGRYFATLFTPVLGDMNAPSRFSAQKTCQVLVIFFSVNNYQSFKLHHFIILLHEFFTWGVLLFRGKSWLTEVKAKAKA